MLAELYTFPASQVLCGCLVTKNRFVMKHGFHVVDLQATGSSQVHTFLPDIVTVLTDFIA